MGGKENQTIQANCPEDTSSTNLPREALLLKEKEASPCRQPSGAIALSELIYIALSELIYKVNPKKGKLLATPRFQRSVNTTISSAEILVSKEFWLVYK
jgi:hypothetical protein